MIKPRELEGVIKKIEEVRENLLEVEIRLDVDNFKFEAGQFINVFVTSPYKRPYSILSADNTSLKILVGVREPGVGTDFFRSSKENQKIKLFGPLGRFKVRETNSDNVLYISAGTGLVPFVSMLKYTLNNFHDKNVQLVNGVRHFHDDPALVYLENDIKEKNIEYTVCVSRDEEVKEGFKGRVTDLLKADESIDYNNTDFYVCGVNQMIKDVRTFLREKGAKNIFVENYG